MRSFDMSFGYPTIKLRGLRGILRRNSEHLQRRYPFVTMRHFLYIVAIAVCEAARIPRQVDYGHFPNFRSVYHGHGASSYQNVHVDNHGGGVPPHSLNYLNGVSDFGLTDHHESGFVPIFERGNELGHVDGHSAGFSTYGGIGARGHHGLETGGGGHPYYGGHFDHGNYFGDHLGHGLH